MLLNFCLAKCGISILSFKFNELKTVKELVEIKNKNELLNFLLEMNIANKTQSKNQYRSLKLLTFSEIYSFISSEKDFLKQYGIKHLYIFGSCVRNEVRVDSDIDFLVSMNQDLTYKEKEENLNILSDILYKKLHHFVDFIEISDYLNNTTIKEFANSKLVF